MSDTPADAEILARELVNSWGGDCGVHYHNLTGGSILTPEDKADQDCLRELISRIATVIEQERLRASRLRVIGKQVLTALIPHYDAEGTATQRCKLCDAGGDDIGHHPDCLTLKFRDVLYE